MTLYIIIAVLTIIFLVGIAPLTFRTDVRTFYGLRMWYGDWWEWRKHNGNGYFHQFLVLTGIWVSPTFEMTRGFRQVVREHPEMYRWYE